jgi:hypothetical protein
MAIYPKEINDWLQSQAPSDKIITAKDVKFDGIQINESGELINIPVIYGYRRIIGPRVYTSLRSDNSNILYTVIVLGHGPVTGFEKIILNEESIPVAATSGVNQSSGTYGGVLSYEFRRGFPNDSIPGLLKEVTGRDSDMINLTNSLRGLAYLVLKMTYSPTGPYKEYPKVAVDVYGRTLRNSSTTGFGSEGNVFRDANPADVLLDYLTNNVYGRGISDSKIDSLSIAQLRNSFAQTVIPYQNAAPVARGQVNYILDTSQSILNNVRDFCRQFGIIMTLANGLYRFTPEYSVTTYETVINRSNLIGGYRETIPDLSVKYNSVSVTFANELITWAESTQTKSDATALQQDGKTLDVNVKYDAITNPYLARIAAETILKKSRSQKTYQFRITKIGLQLTVGDIILWDPNNTGIVTGTTRLRIIEMSMNNDFTFDVTAVTHLNTYYPPFTPGAIYQAPIEISPIQTVGSPSTPDQPTTSIVRPPENTGGTVTVAGGISLEGPLGANFYAGPYEIINTALTQFDNNNYRLGTGISYSTLGTANNFGIDTRIISSTSPKGRSYFYNYTPFITFRPRDLNNKNLGGEGLVVLNGVTYNTLYYVYEIATGSGIIHGWHSMAQTNNTSEFLRFDPQSSGKTVTRTRNGVTAGTYVIQDAIRDRSIALQPPPFVTYDVRGYYGSQLTDSLKYYLTEQTDSIRYWKIPVDVWNSKQGFSNTSLSAVMTIKYFAMTSTGTPIHVANQRINLDDSRPGDTGILRLVRNTSYDQYVLARPGTTPPFTKI